MVDKIVLVTRKNQSFAMIITAPLMETGVTGQHFRIVLCHVVAEQWSDIGHVTTRNHLMEDIGVVVTPVKQRIAISKTVR